MKLKNKNTNTEKNELAKAPLEPAVSFAWMDASGRKQMESKEAKERKSLADTAGIINGLDVSAPLKNLLFLYYLHPGSKTKPGVLIRQNKFWQALQEEMKQDKERWQMSALLFLFALMLALSFVYNYMLDHYLVSFSIDAIVGAAGLVLAFVFFKRMWSIDEKYRLGRMMAALNVVTVAACLVFRLTAPGFPDLTLLFLLISFFAQRQFLNRTMKKIEEEKPAEKN